jgi:hypothetical protein
MHEEHSRGVLEARHRAGTPCVQTSVLSAVLPVPVYDNSNISSANYEQCQCS